jgi:equilibrative nucleoside transporter 1/2/3
MLPLIHLQTSPAPTVQWSTLGIAFLSFLLALSTFFTVSSGLFSAFVLFSGIAMAAAGSYLQTSVVAVASLFGPSVMQSVMSGQAAIAIAISVVQLMSATASVHTATSTAAEVARENDVAAERSARAFFALAALFLFGTVAANAWMTRLDVYKAIVHEPRAPKRSWSRRLSQDLGEERAFLDEGEEGPLVAPEAKGRIFEVAKRNMIYEIAVAYVFLVTLVRLPTSHVRIAF